MKKGQVCDGLVERVDFPGRGIVKVGEETAIVKLCLPGQRIRFRVNKVRNGKAEGRLLEVLERSPLETGGTCSRFGVCGGCTYLSLPYEEQLRIKEGQIRRLFERALERQPEEWRWEGIKGSPVPYEYRNKMEFSFGDEYRDGPLALGMHRRGSFYDIVSVDDCRIVDRDYRLLLRTTLDYFSGKKAGYFHKMTHRGWLRHLLVRKASRTGEILVALVTSSQDPRTDTRFETTETAGFASEDADSLVNGFRDVLLQLESAGCLQGHFAGILHIVNDAVADVIRSDRTEILYGHDYFYEELLGLKFKISVFSFFQTNSHSAEVLYETAREYVGDAGRGGTVFDLYSGTGTITQLMAPAAERVIGVELVEEAVEAARRSAAENGLTNCEFIAGDVLKVLDTIEERPDLIILDPPRDGIHPKALPKIISRGVEHIVYISCKPTSLMRDLETFLAGGYYVERAVCVDQFPWTSGVEAVCLLSRRNV